jgi:hypothetical protein
MFSHSPVTNLIWPFPIFKTTIIAGIYPSL